MVFNDFFNDGNITIVYSPAGSQAKSFEVNLDDEISRIYRVLMIFVIGISMAVGLLLVIFILDCFCDRKEADEEEATERLEPFDYSVWDNDGIYCDHPDYIKYSLELEPTPKTLSNVSYLEKPTQNTPLMSKEKMSAEMIRTTGSTDGTQQSSQSIPTPNLIRSDEPKGTAERAQQSQEKLPDPGSKERSEKASKKVAKKTSDETSNNHTAEATRDEFSVLQRSSQFVSAMPNKNKSVDSPIKKEAAMETQDSAKRLSDPRLSDEKTTVRKEDRTKKSDEDHTQQQHSSTSNEQQIRNRKQ